MKISRLKFSIYVFALVLVASCNKAKEEKQEEAFEESTETTIPLGDNSQVSLDWNGTYNGILPCSDCIGIQTELTIHNDGKYVYKQKYLGKDGNIASANGSIQWDNSGSYITLNEVEGSPRFSVQEGQVVMVDGQDNGLEAQENGAYLLIQNNLRGRDLTGNYWKLSELNGKEITENDYQNEPYLILYTSGDRVFGNSGCNTFRGGYEMMEGNRLKFSGMASTMMACAKDKIESDFLKVLENVDNYAIAGDTLSLNKARMAPLAKFVSVNLE
ncbi:META domain-containing protein [Aegicerativicinus sediminis]